MVLLCHRPGTPAQQELCIPVDAVDGHLGHGDYLGKCVTAVIPEHTPAENGTPEISPSPCGAGKVLLCHQPGTPTEHEICVAPEAVNAHIQYGDYLGKCVKVTLVEQPAAEREPIAFSQIIPRAERGKRVDVAINRPDTTFQVVSFRLSENVTHAEVNFEVSGVPPAEVPKPREKVVEYVSVEHPGLDNAKMANATITFKVTTYWLSQNHASSASIVLSRYSDSNWVDLDTRLISAGSDSLLYEADSPGLSLFAVTVKSSAVEEAVNKASQLTEDMAVPSWMYYAIAAAVFVGLIFPRKRPHRKRR